MLPISYNGGGQPITWVSGSGVVDDPGLRLAGGCNRCSARADMPPGLHKSVGHNGVSDQR